MSGESECSICYEAIISSVSGQAEMSCGHKYHVSCIADWLTSEHAPRSCPLCRREATSHEVPSRRSAAQAPLQQEPDLYHTAEIANVLSNLIGSSSNQNRRRRLQDWLLIDNYMYMNILENNQTPEGITHIWNIVRNSMNIINNRVSVLLNISDADYANLLNNVRAPSTEVRLWNQLRAMIVQEQNAIPANNVNQPDQSMIIYNYT
jgi:hypothetical protein